MHIKKHHWKQIGQFFTAETNYDGVVLTVNVHAVIGAKIQV